MRTRLIFHCLTVTLLTLAVQAQAGKTPPAGCTEAASLVFALTSSPDPSLGSPVKMHASTPTLVIKNVGDDPHCEGDRRIPEESWIWSLDVPLGSHAQLTNANTLTTILDVSFTPDIPGNYTVHLNGCGNQCSVTLVTDIVGKKIIKETVDIADAEHRIVINVLPQVRPHIIPPNQPSPLTEGPNPHREPATAPEHYEKATDFCGNKALLGIGLRPEWFTTTPSEATDQQLQLVEGRVYDSLVARVDTPRGHLDNDAEADIDVDPWRHRLLIDDHPIDKGKVTDGVSLAEGGMRIEWEWPEWPEGFRPLIGDRISALGYHVIDCGHDINTEIHPPIAVATHRPLPVQLPSFGSVEEGKPSVPIGSNVFVPGIVTDIWVHLRGGDALECVGDSLRVATIKKVAINGSVVSFSPCVPQPDQPQVTFKFHVYLPPNPQQIIKKATGLDRPRPALFTQFVNHPETPAGVRTDVPFQILNQESHLDDDQPYLTVSVDLSSMRTGETLAKRLISAWVYPDITSNNYGLQAFRLLLKKLEVIDTGDSPSAFNSGDWRLWVGYSNAVRPWTRLITDSVDEKTYTPPDSVFLPGALGPDGALQGEFLEFHDFLPSSLGRLRMTGYEQDTFGSDDVGEVTRFLGAPTGSFVVNSFCEAENVDIADQLVNSGCAAYNAHFVVEPGLAIKSVLSPQVIAFLNRMLVGVPLTNFPPIGDSELFSGPVSPQIARLTSQREVEGERWQQTFKPGVMAHDIAVSKDPDKYVKDTRRRVLHILGPNPTPKQRAKVAADLRKLKPSIPAALYRKHLCDLETGRPCPAVK